jgi:hypothetical protein
MLVRKTHDGEDTNPQARVPEHRVDMITGSMEFSDDCINPHNDSKSGGTWKIIWQGSAV